MQTKCLHNNSVFIDKNTDSKTDSNITYNYKKRREELNQLVKNHIAKQQQKLTQKYKAIAK
ncbi:MULTISPECIES: hypothetical protein [spotted fever group]|uniref:Uncharacterized protein n=1 Tax=Rickettsia tamurae subsp. buchneri TaxID=1462938 RepID=A0A8E0WKQ6_9RICK|nr:MULTISPECIES: hypothetical protein [spotted fever group]EER20744.1 hypothetical protein REIS_2254 [Rickettsia endosymbiont of Ixodes scapularis]KDO02112.1 hypothetical protein REISMN_08645 [Rickettsia tamurae subsp. buchneri]